MPRIIGIALLIVLLTGTSALAVDYFTFAGGGQRDVAYSLLVDDLGQVLVAGLTRSDDFPLTAGVYGTAFAGGETDLFVLRFSSGLDTLLASTYIGGSGHDGLDFENLPHVQMDNPGPAMTFDTAGNILLTGSTMSLDFPTTPGAFDTVHNTVHEDAFLLRLSPALSLLLHSTLFGGEHKDFGRTVSAEPSGTVVVGGDTRSQGFPVTAGAFNTEYNGGTRDVFLIRFSPDLSSVSSATYFGGDLDDYNRAILLDGSGRYYVTGWANSENLPATAGAYDPEHNGGARDVYVALLSADFGTLEACTYLGGHDWGEPYHGGEHEGGCDEANGLVFDLQGRLVVVGTTHSHDFPITAGVFDPVFNDGTTQSYDGFVAVFSSDLSSLIHASYLGGRGMDEAYAVAVDANGDLVIVGGSFSVDFPVTPGAMDFVYSGSLDGFLARVSGDLAILSYATYLGGSGHEQAYDVALDSTGPGTIIAGYTSSADFLLSGLGYDQSHNGESDVFVFRTDMEPSTIHTLDAGIAAVPSSATLPFHSRMCADVINITGSPRIAGGSLNIEVPGGQYYSNFRKGRTTIASAATFHTCWAQWFPNLPTLDGLTLFQLVAWDVTPAPYNQPPYPASGSVATDMCTVTAARP